jgi:serine/threonine-protein kinase
MPIAPGTRLGLYEILVKVGAGGMGEVYRARHARLERDVAVKVLPEHLSGNARARERFEREAKAIAALSHPNILAIHDSGEENGVSFAVMELLEGETLRQRVAAAPLPWRRAVEIGVEIAEGLAAAHAKGIVHRDLKPENLFITEAGHVKILDFGLARLTQSAAAPALSSVPTEEHTTPGTVLGTTGYMSPEQARGETAGPQSDIFSLGCILHEMLTGKRTFARNSATEALAAILKEDPPPPSASDPSIPSALDALVRHCLEKAPGERFQSARDLAFALRAVVTGSGPAIPPEDRSGSALDLAPFGRRLLVALAGVALLGAGLWLWRPWARTGPPPGPAEMASIAVLPFQNLGGVGDADDYLADGMADAVTADLARTPGFMVIARHSAFQYRARDVDVKKVGAELNVRYLVQGSVQRSGERLRVDARLIDVSTGDLLWTERYDREPRDVFAIQHDVASSVAHAIRPHLAPAAAEAPPRPPPDFEVYDLYLRARAAWNRRTAEDLQRAIELFQEAIRRDPGFAEAYAGLADALITGAVQFEIISRSEMLSRAKAAAERALRLDPTSAEAHTSLGNLLTKELQWDEAEREFRRAIELKPSYATAHHWYAGLLLAPRGRLDEALHEISRAAELDPLVPALNGGVAQILSFRGDYAQARLRAERARELAPRYFGPLFLLSRIHALDGRRSEALAAARRAAELAPSSPVARAQLARAHAESGEAPLARTILAELERQGEPCIECIVDVQLALGDLDAAAARVERGGFTSSPFYFLRVDPAYAAYRGDPRFRRILQAARLE